MLLFSNSEIASQVSVQKCITLENDVNVLKEREKNLEERVKAANEMENRCRHDLNDRMKRQLHAESYAQKCKSEMERFRAVIDSMKREKEVIVSSYKETLEKERERVAHAEEHLKTNMRDLGKVRESLTKDVILLGGEKDQMVCEIEAIKDRLDNEAQRCHGLEQELFEARTALAKSNKSLVEVGNIMNPPRDEEKIMQMMQSRKMGDGKGQQVLHAVALRDHNDAACLEEQKIINLRLHNANFDKTEKAVQVEIIEKERERGEVAAEVESDGEIDAISEAEVEAEAEENDLDDPATIKNARKYKKELQRAVHRVHKMERQIQQLKTERDKAVAVVAASTYTREGTATNMQAPAKADEVSAKSVYVVSSETLSTPADPTHNLSSTKLPPTNQNTQQITFLKTKLAAVEKERDSALIKLDELQNSLFEHEFEKEAKSNNILKLSQEIERLKVRHSETVASLKTKMVDQQKQGDEARIQLSQVQNENKDLCREVEERDVRIDSLIAGGAEQLKLANQNSTNKNDVSSFSNISNISAKSDNHNAANKIGNENGTKVNQLLVDELKVEIETLKSALEERSSSAEATLKQMDTTAASLSSALEIERQRNRTLMANVAAATTQQTVNMNAITSSANAATSQVSHDPQPFVAETLEVMREKIREEGEKIKRLSQSLRQALQSESHVKRQLSSLIGKYKSLEENYRALKGRKRDDIPPNLKSAVAEIGALKERIAGSREIWETERAGLVKRIQEQALSIHKLGASAPSHQHHHQHQQQQQHQHQQQQQQQKVPFNDLSNFSGMGNDLSYVSENANSFDNSITLTELRQKHAVITPMVDRNKNPKQISLDESERLLAENSKLLDQLTAAIANV